MKTVYFDSTFGYPWVTGLSHIFMMRRDREPFLNHIYSFSKEGDDDDIWIPKLNNQEHVVVSADTGRRKPRLPQVCKQYQITHILFYPSAHHLQKFEKARAIISLWPQIVTTFDAPLGSRYQIKHKARKQGCIMAQIS